ncbi:MAG: glycoside hydrolase family 27 protein [Solirubrobacterales bacterium]|nr:glycoside hydrolase family 27 protein [Solirubrobacterales bacterium]
MTTAADRNPALAATPYMGWNTYYGVGGLFDERTILDVANSLLARGLAQAGYRIVWLDFGWASGRRDSTGQIVVDPQQWPHGLAWLTAWLHHHGLLAGIYTDAGHAGCADEGVGSYGHYREDADTFAAWGFDAVKLDFCGGAQEGFSPQVLDTQFATALWNNASHRAMLLNVDNFWVPGQIGGTLPSYANSSYANYRWAPQIAQSWRTDTDVGFTGNILFANVLRNLDHDAAHPAAAGPGHWNDPDYLGPELGMSSNEAQAQLSMWAMLAAPLILGSDARTLSAQTIAMLENPQVIAIDQDPRGIQGAPIQQEGSWQVWAKPLADGARAVALLNRGASALPISTNATAVGLRTAGSYRLEDLWHHTTTTTAGRIAAVVPADSAVLYRLTVATQVYTAAVHSAHVTPTATPRRGIAPGGETYGRPQAPPRPRPFVARRAAPRSRLDRQRQAHVSLDLSGAGTAKSRALRDAQSAERGMLTQAARSALPSPATSVAGVGSLWMVLGSAMALGLVCLSGMLAPVRNRTLIARIPARIGRVFGALTRR